MDFTDLVVLIIGVSSDIGHTLANILHNYGATVVGTYNKNKINEEYETYHCNLKNEEEIKELIDNVYHHHEKISAVINLAALAIDDDLYNKSKKDFMEVLEVNLVGTFLVCKYASLKMERGVIINISSSDGIDTYNPISLDYSASKAGVINLTKNLALRLPNLKVCSLAPSWVDTESVGLMDKNYLQSELERTNQKELLTKEEVALKIIEIIINDDIRSGEVIKI